MKERILFSTDDYLFPDEEFIKAYQEDNGSTEGIYESLADIEAMDFETTLYSLELSLKRVNMFRVKGTIGLWNGTHKVEICNESISKLIKLLVRQCNPDRIRIYIKDGNLRVDTAHHDGNNHFVIYDCSTNRIRKLCKYF